MGPIARNRRALVLVVDGCGIGALPDAAEYGDQGANTLAHVAEAVGSLNLPVLERLGLGSIIALRGVPPAARPVIHGILRPLGPGKDSITGHWEMMGVVVEQPLPTFPWGPPAEVLSLVREAIGQGTICNGPRNGIAAIEQFGEQHMRTGELILYTSQDSVIQLAAHIERMPLGELYRCCQTARTALSGAVGVGRVIARPFSGQPGAFERTDGRRDFALAPPGPSYLVELQQRGSDVYGVGKIADLFHGAGIAESHPGATNAQALQSTGSLLGSVREGLIFVNLIETDQVHGHRKDTHGFHEALRQIDAEIGRWASSLGSEDLLILTADHGVDPSHPGTDHTREQVPLLAATGGMLDDALTGRENGVRRQAHEGPLADVGATVLSWLTGAESETLPGRSVLGAGPIGTGQRGAGQSGAGQSDAGQS
jgi:phosphopentomutase